MMAVMNGKPLPGEVPGGAPGQRRVFRSDPDAPTAGQLNAEFDRLARQAYVGVRDGVLDPEVAFDLACLLLKWGPPDPLAGELAERSAEGTDREQIADLVKQVLAVRFEPGFDLEPVLLERLEQALGVATADLEATGLEGPVRLVIMDWHEPRHAYAEFRGVWGTAGGISPADGAAPLPALVAVAGNLQEAVMEALWGTVWPVCPAHNLGAHAREYESAAVWWCKGDGGHVIAAIGYWDRRAGVLPPS
jgi:hypothetical protein